MTAGRNESQPHDLEGLDDEELVVIGRSDDASEDEPEETVIIGGESRASVEDSDVAFEAGNDDADAPMQRPRPAPAPADGSRGSDVSKEMKTADFAKAEAMQGERVPDDKPPFQGMRIVIIVIMVIVFVFSVLYFLDYYGIVSMPFLRTLTIA